VGREAVTWQLVPKGHESPPPDYIDHMNLAVQRCTGHLWELYLEDCGTVHLHCTKCPAGVDDLYPDGHEMINYANHDNTIVVEAGRHNLPDEEAFIKIPVNARVLSGYNYWGEWEVELIVEDRT
jgi:hypothetical protein